jgi:hypothetical protein
LRLDVDVTLILVFAEEVILKYFDWVILKDGTTVQCLRSIR